MGAGEETAGVVEHVATCVIDLTGYFGISPLLWSSNLPSNDTTKGLVEGLAEAVEPGPPLDCTVHLASVLPGNLCEADFLSRHPCMVISVQPAADVSASTCCDRTRSSIRQTTVEHQLDANARIERPTLDIGMPNTRRWNARLSTLDAALPAVRRSSTENASGAFTPFVEQRGHIFSATVPTPPTSSRLNLCHPSTPSSTLLRPAPVPSAKITLGGGGLMGTEVRLAHTANMHSP
ncbi:hypothetical protein F5888DRAFT_1887436 [Russula emetica]|nr:hypothetical protein F5888DRAFT_1887436 [Russula emetica]